jgi:hypothetical protein
MVLRVGDLALDVGERLASHPALLPLEETLPPVSIKKELSGPQSHSGHFGDEGMYYRCRESTRSFLGRPTHTLIHLPPVSYLKNFHTTS